MCVWSPDFAVTSQRRPKPLRQRKPRNSRLVSGPRLVRHTTATTTSATTNTRRTMRWKSSLAVAMTTSWSPAIRRPPRSESRLNAYITETRPSCTTPGCTSPSSCAKAQRVRRWTATGMLSHVCFLVDEQKISRAEAAAREKATAEEREYYRWQTTMESKKSKFDYLREK